MQGNRTYRVAERQRNVRLVDLEYKLYELYSAPVFNQLVGIKAGRHWRYTGGRIFALEVRLQTMTGSCCINSLSWNPDQTNPKQRAELSGGKAGSGERER